MATEGYKPTSGMQSAARRAIKLKEEGKAKGAGTMVGWTRAGQLARGETLSLSTVKRMYSFFSRHEVDKKGKDFNNAENPSNGKIMWLAWGGDAGFSWSKKIATREKNMKKNLEMQEVVEEIKDMLVDAVSPIDAVVEITDDLEKAKDKFKEVITPRKGEPADKDLYARVVAAAKAKFDVYPSAYANGWVVQEYKRRGGKYSVNKAQGIEDGFEESEIEDNFESVEKKYENCGCETCKAMDVSCEDCPVCSVEMGKSYHSDDEDMDKWDNIQKACWDGYEQQGMKDKGGRKVPNCVYVGKSMDKPKEEIRRSIFGTEGPESLIPRSAE
jgi:hypothetical protein